MTYRLEDRSRLGRIGLAVATAIVLSISTHSPGQPPQETSSLDEWADLLWNAGIDGDESLMQQLIEFPPGSITTSEAASAYRLCVKRWHKTQDASAAELAEARSEALASLDEAMDQDDLAEALKQAVAYQELLQQFDVALEHESVQAVIHRADEAIPELITSGDLMQAQEILFRLKTAYEDTSRLEKFKEYEQQLEDVSTQLQLLRRYDPRDYYQLYRKRAEARGDKEADIRPFNPSLSDRWQQEVSGVRVDMLRSVLDTAAREHIDSRGWQPLMDGGIDALHTLAETPMIEDTFPGLADPERVEAWSSGLEQIESQLAASFQDSDQTRQHGHRIINEISELNTNTLRLPTEVLWREFGDGAMDELDRFSEVIWPYDVEDFNRQMQGEFIGVGVYIEETELGEIRIVSPLEGKPADLAGIRTGDIISTVDGESTSGWSLRDAVREITGPAETSVTLGVRREQDDLIHEYTIVRARIRMHTVKGWELEGVDGEGSPDWNWFIDPDRRIGYIRMTGFDQQTYGDILNAISQMQSERGMPAGLILDLRHNPGGLLETAVNVSNLFIGEGRIVSGEDRFGESSFQATARKRRAYLSGTPVVVLINNGSASASEIVAGCLQAHEAAIVVGARSFGKGSVQTVHPVTDNSKLKLTTQYYRLPSADGILPGRMVHKVAGELDWGVEPDIEVAMTPDQIIASIKVQRESELQQPPRDWDETESGIWSPPQITALLEEGLDPQLHTALVILQAKTYGEHATVADSR